MCPGRAPLDNPNGHVVVTYVLGTFWYPCLRVGHSLLVAIPAGLEPATRGVEIRYSIQLSYGTVIQLSYGTVGARPEPANAPFIALSI